MNNDLQLQPVLIAILSMTSLLSTYSGPKVGIVDYSTGNMLSVTNALKRVGFRYEIIQKPQELRCCDALIMPGVGHFHTAAQKLKVSGLSDAIIEYSRSGLPILGICLGFQLLTQSSEESLHEPGLGIFPNVTVRLEPTNSKQYKVPHIGWNSIEVDQVSSLLLEGIEPNDMRFYFANMYAVKPVKHQPLSQVFYRHEIPWVAVAYDANVFGVQFHPEKSGKSGEAVIKNFLRYA